MIVLSKTMMIVNVKLIPDLQLI